MCLNFHFWAVNNGNVFSLLQNSHSCLIWYHYLCMWVCFYHLRHPTAGCGTGAPSPEKLYALGLNSDVGVWRDCCCYWLGCYCGWCFRVCFTAWTWVFSTIKICISFLPSFCLGQSSNIQDLTWLLYMILPILNYSTSCTRVSRFGYGIFYLLSQKAIMGDKEREMKMEREREREEIESWKGQLCYPRPGQKEPLKSHVMMLAY